MRKSFPRKVPLVIGGKPFETAREIVSVNPNAPDEVVGQVAAAGIAEAEQAIQAAKAAFPGWRDTDFRTRAAVLFQAASRARRLRYDLAALQVFEVGKAWREADADVCEAIDFLEYYGREMLRLGSPERMGHVPGELSHLVYEPKGVAVVIAPWNFPLAISMGMSAAAIVTGNTVVYKPASQSPVIGAMVHELFKEAKLPPGVLNFLPGSGSDIGDHLVAHPDVALIAFTGSKETGLHIVELASRTRQSALGVKTVIAEMGGKNAIIIDADADLDEAVVHLLHSAFGYQGQKCSACSRLIVLEENYDRLVERLQAAAGSLPLGPVEDPVNALGAVIDPVARQKILEYIAIGKEEGTLLLQRDVATHTHHSRSVLRSPRHFCRYPPRTSPGAGGNLRAGAGRHESERFRGSFGGGQQHAVRPYRSGIFAKPGKYRQGKEGLPGGESLHQSRVHGSTGAAPSLWGVQNVGHRLQSRGTGLPAPVHDAPEHRGKYAAPGFCPTG